jgi:membrane protease subunit (stomatin/prohibitin family)
MGVIQDMEKLLQMKTAMAMEKAAENQGEAGAGLGMGLGLMLPGLFGMRQGATSSPAAGGALLEAKVTCPDCSQSIPGDSRFCPLCGHQLLRLACCANCGKNLTPKAKFCPQCGQATDKKMVAKVCPQCRAENLHNAIFCNDCGTKLG